jgi:hypothetical protein
MAAMLETLQVTGTGDAKKKRKASCRAPNLHASLEALKPVSKTQARS